MIFAYRRGWFAPSQGDQGVIRILAYRGGRTAARSRPRSRACTLGAKGGSLFSSRLVRFSSHVSERSDETCWQQVCSSKASMAARELLLDRTRRMELADKRPRSALGADLARRSGERIAARPSQPWQLRSSRWPAPAPSCPSATISTSTTTADAPRQPVTTDDQPGPASVPRRALMVRSDRSSSIV